MLQRLGLGLRRSLGQHSFDAGERLIRLAGIEQGCGFGHGLALPLHHLAYLKAYGARDQCAFSSLGYSFRMQNGEYARVWGLLRDLYATGRKRPTWLGLELVNRIAGGIPFPIAWFPKFFIPAEAMLWGTLVGMGTAFVGSIVPAWSARSVRVADVFSKIA